VWEKIEERIREAGKTTTGFKRTIADWAKAGVAWITGDRIIGRNPDKSLKEFSSLLFTVISTALP
jgi:hypothetical protein